MTFPPRGLLLKENGFLAFVINFSISTVFDISFLDGMTPKELDEDIKRKKERQVTMFLQAN